jgi:putative copper resistance protein D
MASTFASTVGKVELWRVGLSLLPLWALGLAHRPRLALGLTVPPILVSAAVGHSAAIHPMWAVPFKAIHLIALALWIGGLLWIVMRERVDAQRAATDTARVSTIALWAVVVVTISGVAQTLMLVQSIAGIRSAYGLVVVAKAVGLGVLVAFGAYHRRRLVGAIASRGEQAIVTLQSSVARELSVFCVVILLGGFLAYLSPPISGTASARSHSSEARP